MFGGVFCNVFGSHASVSFAEQMLSSIKVVEWFRIYDRRVISNIFRMQIDFFLIVKWSNFYLSNVNIFVYFNAAMFHENSNFTTAIGKIKI